MGGGMITKEVPPAGKMAGKVPPGKQYEAKFTVYVGLCVMTAAGCGVRFRNCQ